MKDGEAVTSTQTILLDKSPCCLELCPRLPQILLVGTYNLVDEKDVQNNSGQPEDPIERGVQHRDGSLVLFGIENDRLYVLCRAKSL